MPFAIAPPSPIETGRVFDPADTDEPFPTPSRN